MSVGSLAYNVVTEFKFEVGGAILGTEQLKGSIEGLSNSADQALMSFKTMSMGIVAQFGLGAGGIAGTLYTALKAADKFKLSQIAMANLMGQGMGFDERMGIAAQHMEKITKFANKFGLPADDLLNLTKLTAPMMRDKKGNPNFNAAIDMSRNLMKAAPTLGVDTNLVAGQLQSAISGHASMGDTLFQRLVADTMEMKGQTSQSFNAQSEHKRIFMLRKALGEFTKDSQVLEANLNTLNGQMTVLRNNISSATGILSEIGQTVMEIVVPTLKEFNAFLENEGMQIAKSIAHGLEPWMKGGWRNLVVSLMQLREFFGDFKLASSILTTVGMLMLINTALKFLKIEIPLVSGALRVMSNAVHSLEKDLLRGAFGMKAYGKTGAMMAGGGMTGFIANVAFKLNWLVTAISKVFAPLTFLVFLFQLFSRAAAIAKLGDLERLKNALPIIAETVALFSRLGAFFMEGFNGLAELIAPIFTDIFYAIIKDVTEIANTILTIVGLATMGFQALSLAFLEFFNQLKNLFSGDGFKFSAIGDAFDFGMEDTYNRIFGKIGDGSGATSNQITNINKVEINNAFKENAQPDRVAFTMKEQIMKAAMNTAQGSRTMQGALVSR
jgi:hypothetical protein